jgi:hypothetical protein
MLTTDQKGSVAELAIAHAAAAMGFDVYKPLTDGGRYDLIFHVHDSLLRVQCKWASKAGEVLIVRTQTCRRIPVAFVDGRRLVQRRLAPPMNNQRLGIHWAKMYEFRSINWDDLSALGAIAQLGERRGGTAEVAGSSPASSTSPPSTDVSLTSPTS